jgi:Icc-related predicted phosphoesterase
VIRVAAVGDVHVGLDSGDDARHLFDRVAGAADVLLLAGDLTRRGDTSEADLVASAVERAGVPVVAVLGNHDYHCDSAPKVRAALEAAGAVVLEAESTVIELPGCSVGIAGTKGFGGGFAGASGTAFGEPEMKTFIRHTESLADGLRAALAALHTDVRVALLHYSPVKDTLVGERLEIFPFLGSYLLGEAVDDAGADLVVHGHAHGGTEKGVTPGGIHVRNVAQPVIRAPFSVYCFDGAG